MPGYSIRLSRRIVQRGVARRPVLPRHSFSGRHPFGRRHRPDQRQQRTTSSRKVRRRLHRRLGSLLRTSSQLLFQAYYLFLRLSSTIFRPHTISQHSPACADPPAALTARVGASAGRQVCWGVVTKKPLCKAVWLNMLCGSFHFLIFCLSNWPSGKPHLQWTRIASHMNRKPNNHFGPRTAVAKPLSVTMVFIFLHNLNLREANTRRKKDDTSPKATPAPPVVGVCQKLLPWATRFRIMHISTTCSGHLKMLGGARINIGCVFGRTFGPYAKHTALLAFHIH